MTQPSYVPIAVADEVRPSERMPVPASWRQDRSGEITGGSPAGGAHTGRTGPDQGYGLKLAEMLASRLDLVPGERVEDAVAGCAAVGLARAALFGRAPVVYDVELAYRLWGYLGSPPAELVAFRVPLFQSVAHEYWRRRAVVDLVPEETLRLSPADVTARLADWRTLLRVPST